MNTSLSASVYALNGAGKTTLLNILPEDLTLPSDACVCLVDAQRLEDAAQKTLLAQVADHAGQNGLTPIFVLVKADCLPALRSSMARLTARLRELGFDQPEIYPISAEAARLFLLPTEGRELTQAEQSELAVWYDRFGPGENSLPGYAVTDGMTCLVGGREVSPLQLRLALENTGLPALTARLEELSKVAAGSRIPRPAPAPKPAEEAPAEPEPAPEPEPAAEAELPAPGEAAPEGAPEAPETEPETVDSEAWLARIEEAAYEDLPALDAAIRALPVDESVGAELRAALARRRWALNCEQLEDMLADREELDCAGLLRLAQRIKDADLPEAIQKQGLETLHTQYQARELTELRELTLDTDSLDIPGLYALIDQINAGPYTAASRVPYTDLLNHRIDELHTKALEEACEGLEEADRETMDRMRAAVEARDCAEVLKTDFYRRLELRKDALEQAELEELTVGAELKSAQELEALEEQLLEGTWNPKFLNTYLQKVSLCREAAEYHELLQQTEDLDSMPRDKVVKLQQEIQERDLPQRLTGEVLKRIDERIYRLDILKLVTVEGDFDALGFDQIDGLRTRVSREEICERARSEYLEKLNQREHALIYENTATHAALVQQVIAQFKLRLVDFDISVTDPKYDAKLKQFWGGSGMEQPRDIPVFLHANVSTLGFSGQRFWYRNGRDLAFLPLAEIKSFQYMKQHLSLNLQIIRQDDTYLLTDAKLFRNNANQVISFLNECLRRWNELSLAESYPGGVIRTAGFDVEALTAATRTEPLTEDKVLNILRRSFAAAKGKAGTVSVPDQEVWLGKTRKLLQAMNLPEKTKIAWFDTSGILGSVKEAVAVGPAGVYLLASKQPLQTVPMGDIFSLAKAGKRVVLTTLSNQTLNLDVPPEMAPLLNDYIRGIQLSRTLVEKK